MDSLRHWATGICLAFVCAASASASPITYAFSTDAGYDGQFSYDAESGVSSIRFRAPIYAGGSLPLDVSWTYENQPALVPHEDAVFGARHYYRANQNIYNDLAHHFTGAKFWAGASLVSWYESAAIRLFYLNGSVLVLDDGTLAQGLTAADLSYATISFRVNSVNPYSFTVAHQRPGCPETLDFAECPDSAFLYWDDYETVYRIVSLEQVPEPPGIAMFLVAMSVSLLQSLRSPRRL